MKVSGGRRRWVSGRTFGIIVLMAMIGCWSAVGLAKEATSGADNATQEPDLVKIRIYTDAPQSEAGVFDLKKKVAILEPPQGYVEILTKDNVLTAKKVIYSQSEDSAELTGEVTVTTEDIQARAAHMQADFGQEMYILEGDVYLRQDEPPTDDVGDNPSKVKLEVWSEWMQVSDGAKRVLARGKVRLVEPEREAWADELDYDDEKEKATLIGDVRIETHDGNLLTGAKVVIDLASDEAMMYGPTYGEFILESSSGDDTTP